MAVESWKMFTLDDVSKHKSKESAYIAIHGSVYDVTDYLLQHPGGGLILLEACGGDGTFAFEDNDHSEDARTILKDFKIGELLDYEPEVLYNKDPQEQFKANTIKKLIFSVGPIAIASLILLYKLNRRN